MMLVHRRDVYRSRREVDVCGTDKGSWAAFLEGTGPGRRSGAKLVPSTQSHRDCWRHCGFWEVRENQQKHLQRGEPWMESWDGKSRKSREFEGVRVVLGNNKDCPLKEGFCLLYVSLEGTKV